MVKGPVETRNNDVRVDDIAHLVQEGKTNAQIADILNADWRHFRDTSTQDFFGVLFGTLEMIDKDVAKQTNPKNDSFAWEGWFDQWNRDLTSLPNPTSVEQLLSRAWSRVVTNNLEGKDGLIKTFDPNLPQDGIEDNVFQRSGEAFDNWQNLVQLIAINDPTTIGGLTEPWRSIAYEGPATEDANPAQFANDAIKALTGGRRFGLVTAANVAAVKQQANQEEQQRQLDDRITNASALATERITIEMDNSTQEATWTQAWRDAT